VWVDDVGGAVAIGHISGTADRKHDSDDAGLVGSDGSDEGSGPAGGMGDNSGTNSSNGDTNAEEECSEPGRAAWPFAVRAVQKLFKWGAIGWVGDLIRRVIM
jgi:hypothetical protein